MPASHLTYPGTERMLLVFFVEDRVQFQKHFRSGILRILRLAKESATDLKDVRIVSSIDRAQNLRAGVQGLIQGRAESSFLEEHRVGSRCHNYSFANRFIHTTTSGPSAWALGPWCVPQLSYLDS